MMNSANNLALFLLIILALSSCRVPNDPFNRPKPIPTIMSNCSGFRDGEIVDATNFIGVNADEYKALEEFYEDIEYRLYICKRFPRRCR